MRGLDRREEQQPTGVAEAPDDRWRHVTHIGYINVRDVGVCTSTLCNFDV